MRSCAASSSSASLRISVPLWRNLRPGRQRRHARPPAPPRLRVRVGGVPGRVGAHQDARRELGRAQRLRLHAVGRQPRRVVRARRVAGRRRDPHGRPRRARGGAEGDAQAAPVVARLQPRQVGRRRRHEHRGRLGGVVRRLRHLPDEPGDDRRRGAGRRAVRRRRARGHQRPRGRVAGAGRAGAGGLQGPAHLRRDVGRVGPHRVVGRARLRRHRRLLPAHGQGVRHRRRAAGRLGEGVRQTRPVRREARQADLLPRDRLHRRRPQRRRAVEGVGRDPRPPRTRPGSTASRWRRRPSATTSSACSSGSGSPATTGAAWRATTRSACRT